MGHSPRDLHMPWDACCDLGGRSGGSKKPNITREVKCCLPFLASFLLVLTSSFLPKPFYNLSPPPSLACCPASRKVAVTLRCHNHQIISALSLLALAFNRGFVTFPLTALMSSLPFTSSHHPLVWTDKLTTSCTPSASTLSYPFPFPFSAPTLSRAAAPGYPALQSAAGVRSFASRPPPLSPPAVSRLHASPAPAVLAEVLQPAFRSSQPRASAGYEEARVCSLIEAAMQHHDALRVQAEAQKDAAISQWMQRCMDDMQRKMDERLAHLPTSSQLGSVHSGLQRRVDRLLEQIHSERNEQWAQQTKALSGVEQRVSAAESRVEQPDKHFRGLDSKDASSRKDEEEVGEQTHSKQVSCSGEAKRQLPAPVTNQSEQADAVLQAVSHPESSQAAASQAADSRADKEDKAGEVAEEEEEEAEVEDDDAVVEDNQRSASAAPPRRSTAFEPFTQPSPTPSSTMTWLQPSQPKPTAQYSRRATAQAEAQSTLLQPLSQPTFQRPPASSPPPSLQSSPSLATQLSAKCAARKKLRRRDEISRLREAAGSMSHAVHSMEYDFPTDK